MYSKWSVVSIEVGGNRWFRGSARGLCYINCTSKPSGKMEKQITILRNGTGDSYYYNPRWAQDVSIIMYRPRIETDPRAGRLNLFSAVSRITRRRAISVRRSYERAHTRWGNKYRYCITNLV